ncbi:BaiN/RdsA family NAD(P)/FAD-dependent oxidoreductase [Pelagerythrobacter rhizovicinus]|uniref:NAD(P)/FAD-dependent oxidoreductase n=1 Tax=Pelagerythrobacter rhizovicinus TaxID=2268576 RepID=A0A4Q2KP56_9SPHN|nr:NAD(P)/FAD-dependent oxidoreductase [Pelagerythrobacter rhizovicinus]RXZ66369.1 NAD(P)/FAD-dependent oxidoreductase [Pelagerythrobacter rhizovicinus]
MQTYDAIVLGGGAAGLMCAAVAGQRGRRVIVLERAAEVGKKILISGGGRCNFTNLNTAPDRYLSANPHFAKSALSRYTARDFLALVEAHGIAWHEKTLGQLFCDGSARQIVAMLLAECAKAAAAGGTVEVRSGEEIGKVSHDGSEYRVMTSSGAFAAPALVIATGGPSIPKMGASDFAYRLARHFGLKVVEPRPALVPLTLGGEDVLFRDLSGVSAEVVARCGKAAFREAALFTHRGLSGPAILQVSSYWHPGEAIGIDFLPNAAGGWLLEAKRANSRGTVRSVLADALPDRLAATLAERIALAGDLGNMPDKALHSAEARLADWRFHPNGSEGFAKAEVTVGGIVTAELSSKTMEARRVPGLYAIGEAVDVTGWLGGYNFQWAWASAVAAGTALAET